MIRTFTIMGRLDSFHDSYMILKITRDDKSEFCLPILIKEQPNLSIGSIIGVRGTIDYRGGELVLEASKLQFLIKKGGDYHD